jgi:D-3-phosphoglycerate dehydrogenase / 2-oxoglutarate reductase
MESRIKIYVEAEDMTRHAAGTVLSDALPRITEIRDIKVDAAFQPHMIYVRNADKPGFIGAFGQLLGNAGVNVATFNLGRDTAGGDAICFVAVDNEVPDALLAQIEAIPQVKRARRLVF